MPHMGVIPWPPLAGGIPGWSNALSPWEGEAGCSRLCVWGPWGPPVCSRRVFSQAGCGSGCRQRWVWPVLTVDSWPLYRFLRRQVRWSGIPISKNFPQFVVIHTVKGFCKVNQAEVDVFLELTCFFYDPLDVCNLISGSSAFSKPSLYIWKFSGYVLLRLSWKDFELYLASIWNECNCLIVWTFFGISLLWNWYENWLFPVLRPLLNFPNLLTLNAAL